jgi:CubicO group peptidase (beta-lactamase class C family)
MIHRVGATATSPVVRLGVAISAATCLSLGCTGSHTATATPSAESARMDRALSELRPGKVADVDPTVRWTLAERMQHYHVPGVSIAVVDSGRIVWAKGFGMKEAGGTDSITPTTRFQAGSISKPTFALGVMRLVQDGTLNLDEDVNDKLVSWHVPNNKFTVREKVTLRRILSHNAGLTVHGFPGYTAGSPIPTVQQILDGVKPANTAPVRVDTTPGAISRYSGGGTTIAMLLVTDVVKEPFPEFMQRTVLGPARMTHSTYDQPLPTALASEAATGHDTAGVPIAGKYHTYPEMSAAGLWTTPSDLATLGILLDSTYAGQTDRVVKQATLQQMLTVQKAPFGIGYEIHGSGQDLEYSHGGSDDGFISNFVMFPGHGEGVAIMTNGANGGELISEIVPSVAAEYGWPGEEQVVVTTVTPDAAALAKLAGTYRSSGTPTPWIGTVAVDGGKLYLSVPGEDGLPKTQLFAVSDSAFFVDGQGFSVEFSRNHAGRVTTMTLAGSEKATKIK